MELSILAAGPFFKFNESVSFVINTKDQTETEDEQIYMLYAYPKSKKDDLTSNQLKQLKQLVEEQLS